MRHISHWPRCIRFARRVEETEAISGIIANTSKLGRQRIRSDACEPIERHQLAPGVISGETASQQDLEIVAGWRSEAVIDTANEYFFDLSNQFAEFARWMTSVNVALKLFKSLVGGDKALR